MKKSCQQRRLIALPAGYNASMESTKYQNDAYYDAYYDDSTPSKGRVSISTYRCSGCYGNGYGFDGRICGRCGGKCVEDPDPYQIVDVEYEFGLFHGKKVLLGGCPWTYESGIRYNDHEWCLVFARYNYGERGETLVPIDSFREMINKGNTGSWKRIVKCPITDTHYDI